MGSLLSRGPGADTGEHGAPAAPPAAGTPVRTSRRQRRRLVVVVATLAVLVLGVALASSGPEPAWTVHPPAAAALPYVGTNYYSPSSEDCPFYSAWTPSCYGQVREQIAGDMQFLEQHGGPGLQRLWISLDQLFSCFDEETGFCGFDRQALADVVDTLRIMDRYHQKADLVLFAQSNRSSDVHSFHFEALDGEHAQMRANYIEAARQFVQHIAADPVAASTVAVVDMENEGYFQNREALRDHTSACDSDRCVDETLSRPFFDDLHQALEKAAPRFTYTLSALRAELLGPDQDYWIPMYPVDVYDVHLYVTDPGSSTALFARATKLPRPWFVGEAGPANHSHSDEPCYTYDGDDPCTARTAAWFRAHLGPDYRAQAVLIENAGTFYGHSDGEPALTDTGRAVAHVRPGS